MTILDQPKQKTKLNFVMCLSQPSYSSDDLYRDFKTSSDYIYIYFKSVDFSIWILTMHTDGQNKNIYACIHVVVQVVFVDKCIYI